MRPLICISLPTAGAYPAVTAHGHKDVIITIFTEIDKTAIFSAITVDSFLYLLVLIVGNLMSSGISIPR